MDRSSKLHRISVQGMKTEQMATGPTAKQPQGEKVRKRASISDQRNKFEPEMGTSLKSCRSKNASRNNNALLLMQLLIEEYQSSRPLKLEILIQTYRVNMRSTQRLTSATMENLAISFALRGNNITTETSSVLWVQKDN